MLGYGAHPAPCRAHRGGHVRLWAPACVAYQAPTPPARQTSSRGS